MRKSKKTVGHRHRVLCQKWLESESGWGTRPDGYSLHRGEEDRQAFVEEYWKGMPNTPPSEYSRPDGTPYRCFVDDLTYRKIAARPHGIRCHGAAPGSGGTDGWVPVRTARALRHALAT